MSDFYEDITKQEINSTKKWSGLSCPKCNCNLIPKLRPNGITKWNCENTLGMCFYTRYEVNED